MNILVLTSAYPQYDDDEKAGITPVVHYFTREWATNGNKVVVIHNANKYPQILYVLSESVIQKINSKVGIVIPKREQRKEIFTIKDGVNVVRLPMLKLIPKHKFFEFQIKIQNKKIINYLDNINFKPDIIIGHWENPQIPLISMIKQKYGCKSALVLHELIYLRQKSCIKWIAKHMKNIDILGCRSKHIANEAKKLLNLEFDPFICYSGIPDEYIYKKTVNINKFEDSEVSKFLYVGQLIERKNVDSIIKALNKTYPNKKFTLDIIGIGAKEAELKRLVDELSLNNQVNFLGRKTRLEVIEKMTNSQCFTMISRNEAFGLVYLEAMASGCIVVASKEEGIDGIIKNGFNGFLCNAGDVQELVEIYKKINNMTKSQKEFISQNAILTANEFRDSNVAMRYLETITKV